MTSVPARAHDDFEHALQALRQEPARFADLVQAGFGCDARSPAGHSMPQRLVLDCMGAPDARGRSASPSASPIASAWPVDGLGGAMNRLLAAGCAQDARAMAAVASGATQLLLQVPKHLVWPVGSGRAMLLAASCAHVQSSLAALESTIALVRAHGLALAHDIDVAMLVAVGQEIEPSQVGNTPEAVRLTLGMRKLVLEQGLDSENHAKALRAMLVGARATPFAGSIIQGGLWLARWQLERGLEAPARQVLAHEDLREDVRASLAAVMAARGLRAAARTALECAFQAQQSGRSPALPASARRGEPL